MRMSARPARTRWVIVTEETCAHLARELFVVTAALGSMAVRLAGGRRCKPRRTSSPAPSPPFPPAPPGDVQVDDLMQPRAQKNALAAVAPLSWSHRIPPANHRRTERITNPICKESAARTVFAGNSAQPRSAGSDSKSKTSELFRTTF